MVDQLYNQVNLKNTPKRVISLVPSLTESICYLGLEEKIVGVTKFCVHPKHIKKQKTIVGGTKSLKLESIKALKPDIIIANKEENNKEDIELLTKSFPVYVSDINSVNDLYNFHEDLGSIFGIEAKTKNLNQEIEKEISKVKNIFKGEKVLYLIWESPLMGAASKTFINHILNFIGLKNELSSLERYPTVETFNLNPDLVFLSSEPFPFTEKHLVKYKGLFENAKVLLVDGEVFSWYGARLLHLVMEVLSIKNIVIKH